MRLSIDFYETRKILGEKKALEALKSAGFDAIDFSYYWVEGAERDKLLGDGYAEYAHEMKGLLNEVGMNCNQAHAPFDFSFKKDTACEENRRFLEIVHAMESAAIMGAEQIVIHSLRVPEGFDFIKENLKYYKSFEPYAEKFGIKVAVENLFSPPYDSEKKKYLGKRLTRPEEMNAFFKLLDSPHFVCCVDVGHCTIADIMPEDYISGMSGDVLRALHIQDNDFEDDRHMLPYLGKINWKRVMASLKHIGYEGDLTMEIFTFLRGFPAELLPDALMLAGKVGRKLIKIFEEA